jgi:hypothetical protein
MARKETGHAALRTPIAKGLSAQSLGYFGASTGAAAALAAAAQDRAIRAVVSGGVGQTWQLFI